MTDHIKSMKLYTNVERVFNELRELSLDDTESLNAKDLTAFDQLHYHGTEALDEAVALIGSAEQGDWLEIGSGLGGPSRYLASKGALQLTALELQSDQNDLNSCA